MPKMLNDGAVEYEDGTPATEAQVGLRYKYMHILWEGCVIFKGLLKRFYNIMLQMGKDVVSFLTWAAEPEMEERKLVCLHLSRFP